MNIRIISKDLMKHHSLLKGFLQWIKSRRHYWWKLCTCSKSIKNENLGEYHGLYDQSDKLLLANIFENFGNKCIEIYELDHVHLLSASGLAWQAF